MNINVAPNNSKPLESFVLSETVKNKFDSRYLKYVFLFMGLSFALDPVMTIMSTLLFTFPMIAFIYLMYRSKGANVSLSGVEFDIPRERVDIHASGTALTSFNVETGKSVPFYFSGVPYCYLHKGKLYLVDQKEHEEIVLNHEHSNTQSEEVPLPFHKKEFGSFLQKEEKISLYHAISDALDATRSNQ